MAKTLKSQKTARSVAKHRSGKPRKKVNGAEYHNPTIHDWEASVVREAAVGEIPERYPISDHRRIFLDLDHLRRWDVGVFQYFPRMAFT